VVSDSAVLRWPASRRARSSTDRIRSTRASVPRGTADRPHVLPRSLGDARAGFPIGLPFASACSSRPPAREFPRSLDDMPEQSAGRVSQSGRTDSGTHIIVDTRSPRLAGLLSASSLEAALRKHTGPAWEAVAPWRDTGPGHRRPACSPRCSTWNTQLAHSHSVLRTALESRAPGDRTAAPHRRPKRNHPAGSVGAHAPGTHFMRIPHAHPRYV
jgi:hypothetical protein